MEEHAGINGIFLRREVENAGNEYTFGNLERHWVELSKRDAGSEWGGETGVERAENPVIAAIREESLVFVLVKWGKW